VKEQFELWLVIVAFVPYSLTVTFPIIFITFYGRALLDQSSIMFYELFSEKCAGSCLLILKQGLQVMEQEKNCCTLTSLTQL
jgi:hypothetical protein